MSKLNFSASEIASKDDIDQAAQGCVQKQKGNGHTKQVYAVDTTYDTYGDTTMIVEDNAMFETGFDYGQIPSRQGNGNLMTNTPVKDLDCANKKYVDGLDCAKYISREDDTLYLENGVDSIVEIGHKIYLSAPQGIDADGSNIKNIGMPNADNDAANKKYIDDLTKFKMPRVTEANQDEAKAIIVKSNAKLQEIDGKLYPDDSDYQHLSIDPIYTKISPKSYVLVVRDSKGNLYTGTPIDDQDCVPYSMYKALLERVKALEQKA